MPWNTYLYKNRKWTQHCLRGKGKRVGTTQEFEEVGQVVRLVKVGLSGFESLSRQFLNYTYSHI